MPVLPFAKAPESEEVGGQTSPGISDLVLWELSFCPQTEWDGARGAGGCRGPRHLLLSTEGWQLFSYKTQPVFWDPFDHKAALQDAMKQEPNSQTQHGAGGKHAAAFQGIAERIPPPSVKKTGCRPHSCSHRQGSPHQHKHIFSVSTKPWLYTTLLLIRV